MKHRVLVNGEVKTETDDPLIAHRAFNAYIEKIGDSFEVEKDYKEVIEIQSEGKSIRMTFEVNGI